MSEIEKGNASLDDFISNVADMVKEMISSNLNIPGDIHGMERKKALGGEIVEAPCPLNCGRKARRFSGKYGAFWKCDCSPDVTFDDVCGAPVIREARIKADCAINGCGGVALRFVSKKDGRPFW
jgi:hypothetical protein